MTGWTVQLLSEWSLTAMAFALTGLVIVLAYYLKRDQQPDKVSRSDWQRVIRPSSDIYRDLQREQRERFYRQKGRQ